MVLVAEVGVLTIQPVVVTVAIQAEAVVVVQLLLAMAQDVREEMEPEAK